MTESMTPEMYWKAMWLNDVEVVALEGGYTLEAVEHTAYRFLPKTVKQAIDRRMAAGIPAHVEEASTETTGETVL